MVKNCSGDREMIDPSSPTRTPPQPAFADRLSRALLIATEKGQEMLANRLLDALERHQRLQLEERAGNVTRLPPQASKLS